MVTGLLLVLALAAGVYLALGAGRADAGRTPDPGGYVVEVEAVVEPHGDVAVFRVRVWTDGDWPVFLDVGGGQITQPLASRPEQDGARRVAEVVVVAALRPHADAARRGAEAELDCRLVRPGGGGVTLADAVAAGVRLADLVSAAVGTQTRRPGERVEVARVNGKAVTVWAVAPRR